MPVRAKRPCLSPGCGITQPCRIHGRHGTAATEAADAEIRNSSAWEKLSEAKLARDPLCADCLGKGVIKQARIAHHPRKRSAGGPLLVSLDELISLCRSHHGVRTCRGE